MRDEAILLLKLKWATARPIRSSRDHRDRTARTSNERPLTTNHQPLTTNQLRRAVRTSRRLHRNCRRAVAAFLGRGRGGFLPLDAVHLLDEQEHRKRDDD